MIIIPIDISYCFSIIYCFLFIIVIAIHIGTIYGFRYDYWFITIQCGYQFIH